MKRNNLRVAVSYTLVGIGVITAFLTVPSSSQAQTGDIPEINNDPDAPLKKTVLQTAKPHRNSLTSPKVGQLTPLSRKSLSGTPGVMSKKGRQLSGRAFGSYGVPFTSKRVAHRSTSAVGSRSGAYLSATYPYSAIGRLTFRTPSGNSFCSASLIRRSIIVTAAHCIQNFGSGSNRFTNFRFTPATYNGSAPYGTWSWAALVRPGSWSNGTDIGSGAARDNDIAVIALRPQGGQFIGNRTGWLTYGWNNYSFVRSSRTGNLWTAALSTLGYPGLLDSGSIMQRTDGPSYLTRIGGARQIYQGSNFTGGSSGGPWLANFGYRNPVFSGGANGGTAAVNNVIVGVTSWGAADPNNPKDNFSSQFAQNTRYPGSSYGTFGAGNIASLLNTLCSARPSGSTQTYQQLGYCN